MAKYKFDPLKHGYEPISKYPELSYHFPIIDDIWFIKPICYGNYGGLVYWYSAITLSVGPAGDDRVKILSGSHDTRRSAISEIQGKTSIDFCGLISSDEFAKELLLHLFGTTKNESVYKEGLERYEKNVGDKIRAEFNRV